MTQMQSLTSSHTQTSGQPVSEQRLPWKTKSSTFSFAATLLLLSMALYSMDYPFGQFRSEYPAVFALSLLCTLSILSGCGIEGVGKRESLGAVQALVSNSQNAGVLSTLFSYKAKT